MHTIPSVLKAMAIGLAMTAPVFGANINRSAPKCDSKAPAMPPSSESECNPDTKSLKMSYYPPNADCQDFEIPVDITWEQLPFNATKWTTPDELQDFLEVATTREPGPNFPSPLDQPKNVSGTYKIAASFCSPKKLGDKSKNVILATHGIGPARNHWNSAFQPEKFNFVQFATDKGYSVFFYDRLGTGASQKISGFDANINTAIAVLQKLATQVKAGKYTGKIGKPSKLALMGFSFGSYTTHGAISQIPDLADAVILTAIGFNKTGLNTNGLVRSFVPRIAALQNKDLYGDRDAGYVTWVDQLAQVFNYFKFPNFDDATAAFAERVKEPFAITEFLTLLSGPQNVDKFKGAALHITGESDYIFCDGFCKGIFDEPAKTIYKNAKKLQLSLVPGASHNINFHKNAQDSYKTIIDFLGANGL